MDRLYSEAEIERMLSLSTPQLYMLKTLRESGPMDEVAMSVNFGRQWRRVWRALHDKCYVTFRPYPKDKRHYSA